MRIDVKGRNVTVTDELREHVEKRFRRIDLQVSELAELEVELIEERNPAIAEPHVAEATLHLKGVTLRARERSNDLRGAISGCGDDLARQVKRHREKQRTRTRREAVTPGEETSAA